MRILIASLLLAAPALADSQDAPPAAAVAPPAQVVVVAPPASVVAVAPIKTPAQLAAEQYRTKIVCRTTIETGSLIAKRKTCLTGKQWEYVDQAHRDEARKMMMDNMGKPPGS